MQSEYEIKQITSLSRSCDKCGLPIINCICSKAPKIKSEAKIFILSTKKELYRPSNTARLLELINPHSTEIFLWERTKEPEKLLEYINNDKYKPFLLFPAEDDETKKRKIEYNYVSEIPIFIIIDGTWKEARKIFRKSSYLKVLPIISLEVNYKSQFDIRKGILEGNLCTIETAIEVLKLNGEIENSLMVKEFYSLFLRSFKAGLNGHNLKE